MINIKIPKFRKCVIQNFPFIEEDFDALTDYQLLCKVVEYLNKVITSQNELITSQSNVLESFDELTLLVNELNERLDDLNVQTEVNNKIEEMVADGSLENILKQLIPNSVRTYFDTIDDMKLSSLSEGEVVSTLGYYERNDGGSALYKIINSSDPADNIFTYQIANGKIAELINKKSFNVLQIGCKRNDETFDNSSILSTILKGDINDTKIEFPEGTYYSSTINYLGDNNVCKNIKLIGDNATIKVLHSNASKTVKQTYNEVFYVTFGVDELDFGSTATINTITMADGKILFYIACSDSSKIPESLTKDMVIKGKDSGIEAIIASIDKSNPDGEGTARIYLYESQNEKNKNLSFSTTGSSILNELLIVKYNLGNDYLYMRFNDNVVPSAMAVNNQIQQASKTARINNISITYEDIHFVELNCLPENSPFSTETPYIESGIEFNINDYSNYYGGLLSLNKFDTVIIRGITFDGNNIELSKYESNGNTHNIVITGGCKNVTFENCKFINSIMAGLQIGGIGNSNSAARHDYPENVTLTNCYFNNNGRGDIEIIYGRHINIENSNGNGTLDIEPNGSEILENITISNCNFKELSPYSPATSTNSTIINVINSCFNTILAYQKIKLNLTNCSCHVLKPYVATINGVNIHVDYIGSSNGNEKLFITNSSFYGLYQTNPASQHGTQEYIKLNNCIIDLSLVDTTKVNRKNKFELNDCLIISQTTQKQITDTKSNYIVSNCIFKNVEIYGGSTDTNNICSSFINCRFLSINNTLVTSENVFNGTCQPIEFIGCYFETNVRSGRVKYYFKDCILNSTTKPSIKIGNGAEINGIKTNDNTGINWSWLGSAYNDNFVKFENVEFNPNINSNLGLVNYGNAVSVTTVADGCTGYFVGTSTHALVQLYHNSSSLALRYVDYQ